MSRRSTDEDYNKDGNEIHMKIEIYFNGIDRAPLEVTQENYLIDAEILEESGADTEWPLGEVSANELSFTMFNEDGIFSTINEEGPYYGKIKLGVIIKAFIRPFNEDEDIDWDPMGVYKVTSWQTTITGTDAMVVAQDAIKDIYTAEKLTLPITVGGTFGDFYEKIFNNYELPIALDPALTSKVLPYAFMSSTNAATLQDVTVALRGICMSNRLGQMQVRPVTAKGNPRAILTDENQIINADADQNLLSDFSATAVYYNSPQKTLDQVLLNMRTFVVNPGIQIHDKLTFSKGPNVCITSIVVETEREVSITGFTATSEDVTLTTESKYYTATEVILRIYGVVLEHVEQTLADDVTTGNTLEIDNKYIQTQQEAKVFKTALDAYIVSKAPELLLTVRGNPLLQIGDKIKAVSELYDLSYTGIIKRSILRYDGGLTGILTLVDVSVLGGV